MQPNKKLVTISDNETKIKQLLHELVLQPRVNAIKWANITKQTPNIKIGYPGQHLASLITGMQGERTGARGNDLVDGYEVKSCSRIDQLDKCKDCEGPVARGETICSGCASTNILRTNDSKWLFTIRNENDLTVLLRQVKRVVLILGDYPNFESGDFETLRFQSFEIWPDSPRNRRFGEIITNYYHKIYLEHKKKDATKTPAPKNFWPYTYQFYICNPIPTFSCIITDSTTKPKIDIKLYVKPDEDRSVLPSANMPTKVLDDSELNLIIDKIPQKELSKLIEPSILKTVRWADMKSLHLKEKRKLFRLGIEEQVREILPLRDTDKISTAKAKYSRRANT